MKLDKNKTQLCIAEKKKSISSICISSGLSHSTVIRAISGKTSPRPATLGKIADAIGVDLELILEKDS